MIDRAAILNVPSDVWLPLQLWKDLVKWRAGWQCEDCEMQFEPGKPKQNSVRLVSHHVDGDGANNVLNNGKSLCSTCHRSEHASWGASGTAEERSARTKKSWETRRARGTINSRFARMTPEELSEKNKKSAANSPPRERDERGHFK